MFDLPAGFGYRIVSQAGEAMDDGYVAPGHFDGMACFRLDRQRVALVRNHELNQDHQAIGPTGGLARLQQRLRRRAASTAATMTGWVLPGGTSTIVYDLASAAAARASISASPAPWSIAPAGRRRGAAG